MERYAAPRGHDALTLQDVRCAVAGERRQDLRFPCCAKRIAMLRSGGDGPFRNANLVDCSPGGIGLSTDHPMSPGEQFLVKLRVGKRLRVIVYTVRHCVSAGPGRFTVGAQFAGVVGAVDEGARAILDALVQPSQ